MPVDNEVLNEIKESRKLLGELVQLTRVTAMPAIRAVLRAEFDNAEGSTDLNVLKRKAYYLSDGRNSTRDIEKLLSGKISQRTVARYQSQWRRQGIACVAQDGRKTKADFDLEDFGIELPLEVKKPVPASSSAESQTQNEESKEVA